MAGLLEQFSKGLFGLAPTPAPNGVFGQVLDSAAQWGRGVQDKAANIQTTLADLLRNPSNVLPNIPPQTLANLLQQPVTPEQKQNIASKALDFGMEFGPLTFIGPSAKTWNKVMAQKAQELDAAGVDPRKIWQETGTWKAPDGQWRQEIPDNSATMAKDTAKQLKNFSGRKQSQIFSHEDLYSSYPSSANQWVIKTPGQYDGAYTPGHMGINDMVSIGIPSKNPDISKIKSTNLHEIQHSIQELEGWATGGSVSGMQREYNNARARLNFLEKDPDLIAGQAKIDELWNKVFDQGMPQQQAIIAEQEIFKQHPALAEAKQLMKNMRSLDEYGFDAYKKLAGEAEARATQARIPLNAAQRRATFPADSYDVPLDQLIIRR